MPPFWEPPARSAYAVSRFQHAVEAALIRIQAHGKAAGILTADQGLAKRYLELGATFVAIGNDVGLLANGASRQLSDFRNAGAMTAGGSGTAKVY